MPSAKRGFDSEVAPMPRAKLVTRRSPATWVEGEDAWSATVGRFHARVCRPTESARWEWSALATGASAPRAVGCKGFPTREEAQLDAESTIAELG